MLLLQDEVEKLETIKVVFLVNQQSSKLVPNVSSTPISLSSLVASSVAPSRSVPKLHQLGVLLNLAASIQSVPITPTRGARVSTCLFF